MIKYLDTIAKKRWRLVAAVAAIEVVVIYIFLVINTEPGFLYDSATIAALSIPGSILVGIGLISPKYFLLAVLAAWLGKVSHIDRAFAVSFLLALILDSILCIYLLVVDDRGTLFTFDYATFGVVSGVVCAASFLALVRRKPR